MTVFEWYKETLFIDSARYSLNLSQRQISLELLFDIGLRQPRVILNTGYHSLAVI